MAARIKLVRRSQRNHRDFNIVVQPGNSYLFGPPTEVLGFWNPVNHFNKVRREIGFNTERFNYYFGSGATITKGAYKILEKIGVVPKKPIPFGFRYTYSKTQ